MLRNIVGIVTGGSSGLGAATVASLIRHGGRVMVADLPQTKDNYLRLAANVCAEVSLNTNFHKSILYPSSTFQNTIHNTHQDEKEELSSSSSSSCSSTQGQNAPQQSTHKEREREPIIAFSPTDVRKEEDIRNALDLAEETFGEPVNVAINCAGVAPARKLISKTNTNTNPDLKDTTHHPGPFYKLHSLEEFTTCMDINVIGSFNVARLAAERMIQRSTDSQGLRGCIIHTASIAAYEGQMGQVAYATSKSAIVGMTLPMARDLASYGIRVMTIAPGLFKTPLLDTLPDSVQKDLAKLVPCPSRLGDPDEFGQLVISILTNPMLNGEVIRLDGALRMPAK